MSFECLDDDDRAAESHERRITRCRAPKCNAKIIWLKTPFGKKIPADEGTVEAGEYEFAWGRHSCHFETCADRSFYGARRP